MFCKKCGTKLEDGSKFCGKCGTPQAVADTPVAVVPTPITETPQQTETPATETEPQKFEFERKKYLLGLPLRGTTYKTIHTTIEFENNNIMIHRLEEGRMVHDTHMDYAINPQDISDIQVKKVWNFGYVAYVVLCVVIGLLGGEWYVWIFALLGLFGLKSKEIILYYQREQLVIPDSNSDTEDAGKLITYLQNLNPVVRVHGME